MIDYLHKGPFEQFILYECGGMYLLRSRRTNLLHRVTWHKTSEWGVYIKPEGNITGLHYFADEVVHVAQMPGK